MKQHLAKSLLMASAMIASYPLLAQQTIPAQPVQPAQQGAQQGVPSAAPDTYAQGSGQSVQYGVPPRVGAPMAAPMAAPGAPAVSPALDPSAAANTTLPPDALGTRLGQRSPFLDGA